MRAERSQQSERKARPSSFRRNFIKNVPIGTLVEDTNLTGLDGEYLRANTAPGAIYKERKCDLVNVTNIGGIQGNEGVWTARFVKKVV